MKTEEVGGFGLLPSSSNYKYDVKHTDMKIFNKLLFMLLAVVVSRRIWMIARNTA